jgi:phage-related protein (TIGR01555 family)
MLHLDGWENLVTALGTVRDKLTAQRPTLPPQLSDSTLEAMHTGDDLCARIVEQLPLDALRSGFSISLDAADVADPSATAKDLNNALKALKAHEALAQAWIWARLYGFGAVLLGVDDGGELDEPLELEHVRSLTHLHVLRRPELQPAQYYDDIEAPQYGQVEVYQVIASSVPYTTLGTGPARPTLANSYVHESRLLKFRGVPTSRWGTSSAFYWDDSILQRVFVAMQAFSATWQGAAHLMTDASQAVIKLTNLMQLVTAAGEEKMRQRMRWLDIGRSVARAVVLDERESFERIATPFTGIPELLDRFMVRVASAANMPVTVLFGRSPAGMNATGESDTRTWYDQVSAQRTKDLTPQIEHLTRVLMSTDDGPTDGNVLEGFCVDYPALWQPTDKEAAETFKLIADALVALANAKIILPEEAAVRLAKRADFTELDVAAREAALKYELERGQPDALPAGGVDPLDPAPDQPASDTALNGAQVQSMVDVVRAVVTGEIPREAAVGILSRAFLIPEAGALKLLASVVEKEPEPQPPQLPPPQQLPPQPPQDKQPDDQPDDDTE